jgi:methyl-accepting chemotaxis protein
MRATASNKKVSFGLTTILALAFFLLSVVSLVVSGVVQILAYLGTQQETIKGKQQLIAREATNAVGGFIQDKRRMLSTAVDLTNPGDSSREARQRLISNLLALEPSFRNLVLLDSRGERLAAGSHISRYDADRFLGLLVGETAAGMRRNDVYLSNVYIEILTGEPMIILSVVERNAFKDLRSILVAELDLKFMWDLIGTVTVGENGLGNVYVVDRQGALIAFKDTTRILKGEKLNQVKAVAEFIAHPETTSVADIWTYDGITGKSVVGTYQRLVSPDWAVVTEVPVSEAYREVTQATLVSVIVTAVMALAAGLVGFILARRLSAPLVNLTATAAAIAAGDNVLEARVTGSKEVNALAEAFNSMTAQLRTKAEGFKAANLTLSEIVSKARDIVLNLKASATEIESAAQEQTTASNEHASGITEVSATLQELTITAKQITNNVGDLVLASEEAIRVLKESEQRMLRTVAQLEEAGAISRTNAAQIAELGKRSVLVNDMVELIREVANKTNILSINASIEASRSGEAGSGFSVVAAEIRELSKETIDSAKKADQAAKEIQNFLNSIIASSENESAKVVEGGSTVKDISRAMGEVVTTIGNNYSFTQKIDVSIKQQESGSVQAAETMRQMAEISRQSAETARQTLAAVKDIVRFAADLEGTVGKYRPSDAAAGRETAG